MHAARMRTKAQVLELKRTISNLKKENDSLKRDAKQVAQQLEQALLQNRMILDSTHNIPERKVAAAIQFGHCEAAAAAAPLNYWAGSGLSTSSGAMSSAGDALARIPSRLEFAIAECGAVNGVSDATWRLSLLKCLRDERLATASRIRRAELDGSHQQG